MRISQKTLRKRFKKFNEKYFDNLLVLPKFIVGGSNNVAGTFLSNILSFPDENGEYYVDTLDKIRIYLSKKIIRDDKTLNDILLHEMIHYYGYMTNEDIEGEHGDWFMTMAEKINKDGYNIDDYYYE